MLHIFHSPLNVRPTSQPEKHLAVRLLWIRVYIDHCAMSQYIKRNKELGGGFTIVADVPPACDGTLQATWEEDSRGRQADRTDIICPG